MVNNQMAETLPAIKANSKENGMFGVGKSCPEITPERNVAIAANDKANNLAAIAKNVGMTEKCQQTARTHSEQFMSNTKAAAAVMIGAAALATTKTNTTLDNEMSQSGCGAFALTANTIMNETNNITCNINETFSSQTQTAVSNASINLTTVRPTPEAIETINETVQKMQASINAMSSPERQPPRWLAETDKELYRYRLKMMYDNIANARKTLALYIKQNPTSAGVYGSNITLKLKKSIKMSASQTVSSKAQTNIQSSVKNIAAAVAFNKVSQVAGVNSLDSNSKNFLQQKVTDAVNTQTNNIKSQISQNTMSLNDDGSINMRFSGPIVDSTIFTDLNSQADLQINQVITSAVTIGQQVASEIISDIASHSESTSNNAGLDEMVKQAHDGLAKQIETSDKGQNEFMGGFFDMIGGLFLIPLIIGVAILLFFPQISNIIAPGPLKYVLVAVLMYFILAWFIGFWPFGNSEKHSVENYGPIQRLERLAHLSKNQKPRTQKNIPYNYNYPVLQ
tara:strand:- start:883 stop:2412 length:1530 start_codon:yes stop_codon:yes gene_type:complete